jgi:asparagine synthase (glutamine-hydrolysing)
MKTTLAVLSKYGDNVVDRVLDVLNGFSGRTPCHFGLVSPQKSDFEKSPGVMRRQGLDSSCLIGIVSSRPIASSSYEFLQLDEAALVFEGKMYAPVPKTAVLEQVAKDPLHCEALLQTLIKNADGNYSLFMVNNGGLAAGRDPVGVQPLYFGENKDITAIATNRRALWQLGIEQPSSFPPGNLAFANREGFQLKPVKTLAYKQPEHIGIDDAAKKLQTLIEQSVKRRIQGLKEVAVAFSGGLDSSLVAFLACKLGVKVTLQHVSLENQAETEEAIAAAEKLDLPLEIDLFKDSDVEKTLPKVVELIEEADPIKASIGLPFYWAAEKAVEDGFKVVLAGQGADELFGGYQRYVTEYCKDGAEAVQKTMFGDVTRIHESNLERDLKICGFFDVELRLPFAQFELAEFAMGLPVELKMEQKADTARKLVLRKAALNLGLPTAIAQKPKKAVQYSTGINDAMKRVAKKQDKTVNEYITELFQQSKNHN